MFKKKRQKYHLSMNVFISSLDRIHLYDKLRKNNG